MISIYFQGMRPKNSCSNPGLVASCQFKCPNSSDTSSQVYFYDSFNAKLDIDTSCLLSPVNLSYSVKSECSVICERGDLEDFCLYTSLVFWIFVIVMVFAEVGHSVCNTISDATCFDLLGCSPDPTMSTICQFYIDFFFAKERKIRASMAIRECGVPSVEAYRRLLQGWRSNGGPMTCQL